MGIRIGLGGGEVSSIVNTSKGDIPARKWNSPPQTPSPPWQKIKYRFGNKGVISWEHIRYWHTGGWRGGARSPSQKTPLFVTSQTNYPHMHARRSVTVITIKSNTVFWKPESSIFGFVQSSTFEATLTSDNAGLNEGDHPFCATKTLFLKLPDTKFSAENYKLNKREREIRFPTNKSEGKLSSCRRFKTRRGFSIPDGL